MHIDWRTRPLQYAVVLFYSIVIALFWFPALCLRRIARLIKETGSEGWPQADGTVLTGDVKVTHGWILDYAVSRLEYTFRVSGEYFAGSITKQFADEQAAWEFVDARRGKNALIRYRDGKAETSVLREADQRFLWGPELQPGFFVQLWRHWSDELRREPSAVRDDEEL